MLKTGLELKQQQKLSPLQIQTIKLIEMPVQDLEQRIRTEIEENPVLDDTPSPDDPQQDVSLDALAEDDYIPSYRLKVSNWGKDERPEYDTFSVKESFSESLEDQLGFCHLTPHETEVAKYIIGSIGSNGYLERDISSLVDDMDFRCGIKTDEDEVERLLNVVQGFDPAGVGARDLQECLLLQLKRCSRSQDVIDAERILGEEFEEFKNKHFDKLKSRLGLNDDRLKAATARIVRLNPSPGEQNGDAYASSAQQIVPDFVLTEKEDGSLGFEMPRGRIPQLRVSKKYSDMLENSKGASDKVQKDTLTFVKQKVDMAKWFVEAIKQRNNTLTKTMQAILDYQYEYFQEGDDTLLKPMVLKDIAEKTGFDISTISRVVNKKYIETPFGIYPLKYFFAEGLENKEGEEVSTRGLKKALQDIVDAENKRKPLTDEQLVVKMEEKGYKVARRTIAKYRDQLGIPLARLRKEI